MIVLSNEKNKLRKAIIMAGGEGSRLRPITCDIPKPMVSLCGRPAIEHILELLLRNGIEEAAVTLMYLPEVIHDRFESGEYKGIRLRFVEEDYPLGSAGSVKNAVKGCGFDEDVLVISGDAICDFDIRAAYESYKSSGCEAEIIAKRVDDPGEYGLIRVADNGERVESFIEKPSYTQAVSDLANTGVYILSKSCVEMIPDKEKYDFSKDLFPKMLEKGIGIACFEEKGYWKDIGGVREYIECQRDMLKGKAPMFLEYERDRDGNVILSEIPKTVVIDPPVFIGKGVRIDSEAVIEERSVISDGAVIESGTHIKASVILENSRIKKLSSISGAVVCHDAVCESKSMMFEKSVLGPKSVLGKGARVNPGIRIWQEKNIGENEVVDENVKFSDGGQNRFCDTGLGLGEFGISSAIFCIKLGAAMSDISEENVAVGCEDNDECFGQKENVASGIICGGKDCIDFGRVTFGGFVYGMIKSGAERGVYLSEHGGNYAKILESGGMPAIRESERKIEKIINFGEYGNAKNVGNRILMEGIEVLYENDLKAKYRDIFRGKNIEVLSDDKKIKQIIETVVGGARNNREKITIICNKNGDCAIREDGVEIGKEEILEICCIDEFENGRKAAVGYGEPKILDEVASACGGELERYFDCPADGSDGETRKYAVGQGWNRDFVLKVLKASGYISKKGASVKEIKKRITPIAVKTETEMIYGKLNPGKIVGEITGEEITPRNIGEGKILKLEKGYVILRALKRGNGIKVIAEAADSETAEEICGEFMRTVKRKKTEILDF